MSRCVVSFLLAFLLAFTASPVQARGVLHTWDAYGYSIELPAGWTIEGIDGGELYKNPKGMFEVSVYYQGNEFSRVFADGTSGWFERTKQLGKICKTVKTVDGPNPFSLGVFRGVKYTLDTQIPPRPVNRQVDYLLETPRGPYIVTGYTSKFTPHAEANALAIARTLKLIPFQDATGPNPIAPEDR